jgi:hypothetical protein
MVAWQLFRLEYNLLSSLHIGYHVVGNVQRTRYYVPARNLWAAATERLVRGGFDLAQTPQNGNPSNYQRAGEFVGKHCRFSYLFLRDSGRRVLYPCFGDGGLRYGGASDLGISREEFERRFLSSYVATALDATTGAAAEAGLHEVEFISPYEEGAERTRLCGWVWIGERGITELGGMKEWRKLLGELQVGGERRYGFGRLRLAEDGFSEKEEPAEDWPVAPDPGFPRIKVEKQGPILAHVEASDAVAKGMVEPVVGRETTEDSGRFGGSLSSMGICWVPGSLVKDISFHVAEKGIWKVEEEG